MRTTEERMNAIRQRTAVLKAEQRRRKQYVLSSACAAACLLIVIGLGIQMPGLVDRLPNGEVLHTSGAASLIGSNTALGYILMGVLAFLLGVSVTLLLYRLSRKSRQETHKEDENEF